MLDKRAAAYVGMNGTEIVLAVHSTDDATWMELSLTEAESLHHDLSVAISALRGVELPQPKPTLLKKLRSFVRSS